jgi:hypothetical protein
MVTNALFTVCDAPALREVHQATIRAHHAKAGYDYPTIHFPPAFSPLVGLPTQIYETVHNGALAFLVVVSPNAAKCKNANLSPKPSPSHGGGRRFELNRSYSFFSQSAALNVSIEA